MNNKKNKYIVIHYTANDGDTAVNNGNYFKNNAVKASAHYFVDKTNNKQNWERWRYKYDNVIKTPEDSYVAIETMLASLNDSYTKFLDPKEFEEETSSIKGSLKGIGIQIGLSENGKK